MIRRGFLDLAEGQIHYRSVLGGTGVPLLVLHYCPGSSKQMERIVTGFGARRPVYAPDMPGNGDSAPPAPELPDIAYLADVTFRVADALHLPRFDLYGCHIGARIATEMAIAQPDRVRRVILEGFALYSPTEVGDILATYCPAMKPDVLGTHLLWAWAFVRDGKTWFPWNRRDRAHRMDIDLPGADALHDDVVELLKALRTYHRTYQANFRYVMRDRVPSIPVPTLMAFARGDMCFPYLQEAARLLPGAEAMELPCGAVIRTTDADLQEAVSMMEGFLDRPDGGVA